MKKIVLSLIAIFAFSFVMSSCRTGEKCPAYSQKEVKTIVADKA